MRIYPRFSPNSTASSELIMNAQPVLLLAAWADCLARQAASGHSFFVLCVIIVTIPGRALVFAGIDCYNGKNSPAENNWNST